ncbi:MAG: endonuclease III [Clostridia bacterium]|nr:endonuclease III [Clostridia bacterium]MBR3640334.1 endonuclease III [Clostridia bacterium]
MTMQTDRIISTLADLYPDAVCSLEYGGDPWRLLVAARLSAQCTDERVNIVCRPLFERFPDPVSAMGCDIAELEEIIKPCGLFRMKAKNIRDASRMIVDDFGGKVPDTMEGLLSLPGVGRKIANLILGDVYGKGGIVADTHCIRICGRLGYYGTDKKDPVFTERTMEKVVPREEQSAFCHRLVLFGREYCSARAPRCGECPLKEYCSFGKSGALR